MGAPAMPETPGTFQNHRYAWTTGVGNWEQVEQELSYCIR
jgi:hypothetical protein